MTWERGSSILCPGDIILYFTSSSFLRSPLCSWYLINLSRALLLSPITYISHISFHCCHLNCLITVPVGGAGPQLAPFKVMEGCWVTDPRKWSAGPEGWQTTRLGLHLDPIWNVLVDCSHMLFCASSSMIVAEGFIFISRGKSRKNIMHILSGYHFSHDWKYFVIDYMKVVRIQISCTDSNIYQIKQKCSRKFIAYVFT